MIVSQYAYAYKRGRWHEFLAPPPCGVILKMIIQDLFHKTGINVMDFFYLILVISHEIKSKQLFTC